MVPSVDTLIAGDLVIEARASTPSVVRLDWRGRSSERNPAEALSPFFDSVLSAALETGCALELHFERLEFFNSSTVTSVIHLIRRARAQSTTLTIAFNGELKWQALSFEALKSFELPDGLLQIRPVTVAS